MPDPNGDILTEYALAGLIVVSSASPAPLAVGVAVYTGQVFFGAWWLRRYRYGPVEWLWRTLMYGMAQPMLRLQIEAVR